MLCYPSTLELLPINQAALGWPVKSCSQGTVYMAVGSSSFSGDSKICPRGKETPSLLVSSLYSPDSMFLYEPFPLWWNSSGHCHPYQGVSPSSQTFWVFHISVSFYALQSYEQLQLIMSSGQVVNTPQMEILQFEVQVVIAGRHSQIFAISLSLRSTQGCGAESFVPTSTPTSIPHCRLRQSYWFHRACPVNNA